MVSVKMLRILLSDSLGYLLQGADLITQMQPVEEWFTDFFHTRHEQPYALVQNSHEMALSEITGLIRNVHSNVLAHASLTNSPTVVSIFDTSVLYCFYVVRTLFQQPPAVFDEEDIFTVCYDEILAKKFLKACMTRDRALLLKSLSTGEGGEMLGIPKKRKITDQQWVWLFTLASVIARENVTHDKVTLVLQSAEVVKRAYKNAVAQPRSQSEDRQRHISRLPAVSMGRRLEFE